MISGPGGARLVVEPAADVPLVWFRIAVLGGSTGDPPEQEGFTYHMATLSRRGAAGRSRAELDDDLDALGATLEVTIGRDAATFIGLCLARHLDAVIDIAADVLARPAMSSDEHDKLVRESLLSLDEIRDDDGELAARFFNRYCAPGHPWARAALGTEASLARLVLSQLAAARERQFVPANLVIGLAGDMDEARGEGVAQRLLAALGDRPAPPLPSLAGPEPPAGRRLLLVDKPKRTQSQVLIGHLGPAFASDEFVALAPVLTALGGTFTSRLMQEIRVARGWSYGVGCELARGRGPRCLTMHLAPGLEVTPEAIRHVLSLYEDLVAAGIREEELEFARAHLTGSLMLERATARQRMARAVRNVIYGLPPRFDEDVIQRLEGLTLAEANAAVAACLHPDRTLTVAVTSAEAVIDRLSGLGLGELDVVPFAAY